MLSYFPEITTWKSDKIKKCLHELFSYTPEELEDVSTILKDIQHVQELIKLPKVAQRSTEWFDMRKNKLTASDLAQAIGRGKYGNRKTLISRKAFPEEYPFKTAAAMTWGTMFEEMGIRCYQQNVNPVKMYEFGMIPHTSIYCFGASPDGITETGLMVEMKCPMTRQCDNTVPEHYYIQIQGQLATCELTWCDYIECYFDMFHDLTEYKIVCHDVTTKNHGIILEFANHKYIYSPPDYTVLECMQWANEYVEKIIKEDPNHTFIKMKPWKLKHLFHKQVKFDPLFWDSIVPDIYAFWKEVEQLRLEGIPKKVTFEEVVPKGTTLDISTPKKYKFITDPDDE